MPKLLFGKKHNKTMLTIFYRRAFWSGERLGINIFFVVCADTWAGEFVVVATKTKALIGPMDISPKFYLYAVFVGRNPNFFDENPEIDF